MGNQNPFGSGDGGSIIIEGDDLLNFPTQYVGNHMTVPNPKIGDLSFDTEEGKMLVYTGDGDLSWKEIDTTPPAPVWREVHYAMRAGEEVVGIYKTTEAGNTPPTYTLYTPGETQTFHPLAPEEMHPQDYDTHIAFGTFPVLEVENTATGGVLLKLPDEPDKL